MPFRFPNSGSRDAVIGRDTHPQPAHLGPHSQHTWDPTASFKETHEPWGGFWDFYFYFLYFKSQGRWANSWSLLLLHASKATPSPSQSPSPSHLVDSAPLCSTRSKALPQGIPGK